MAPTIRPTRALGALAAVTLAGATLAACGTQHVMQSTGAAASGPSARATVSSGPASAPAATPSTRPAAPSSGTPGAAAASPPTAHHGGGAPAPTRTPPPAHTTQRPHGTAAHGTPDRVPARGAAVTARSIQHGVEAPGRAVALTFDDGPDPVWTPRILEVLARHHAKATFCEIGPNARAHPGLVREIAAAGHRLCDHSVHHDEAQSHKSEEYNRHEILDARSEISRAAGTGDTPLWYYRAPGGDFSPAIRAIAADHGLRPLGWTVDSEDWRRPGADAIVSTVNSELRPGAIVLMHDGGGDRAQTVQALETLLDRLDAAGYTYTFPAR